VASKRHDVETRDIEVCDIEYRQSPNNSDIEEV
jgi:hypothetical protein